MQSPSADLEDVGNATVNITRPSATEPLRPFRSMLPLVLWALLTGSMEQMIAK